HLKIIGECWALFDFPLSTYHKSITVSVVTQRINVITIAELMHQAHVAPITNGSRNVRYIENKTPNQASDQIATVLNFINDLGPYC
ncbi:unnamed protein product, partial [marine sediment metagenome]